MTNFAEFTRKHLYRNPFLVFSFEFCKICKNTFLAEQHRTTANCKFHMKTYVFPKECGANSGVLSALNTRFNWKKYLLSRKSRSSHRRSSVKESLQRPAQVFSYEYCKIFKNTYCEKHLNGCFLKSGLQWQIYRREIFPELFYPFN